MSDESKQPEYARSARELWDRLLQAGLRPEREDSDFLEKIAAKIEETLGSPIAPLPEGLAQVGTDDFVRAFFSCTAPFARMSQDIVAFFKRAGARRTQQQLRMKIERVELGLEDFVEFVRETQRVRAMIDLPRFPGDQLFPLVNALYEMARKANRAGHVQPLSEDVREWLADFERARLYNVWPVSLAPDRIAPGLRVLATALESALQDILAVVTSQQDLLRLKSRPPQGSGPVEMADLIYVENDHWMRNCLEALAQLAVLDDEAREPAEREIEELLANFPRQPMPAEVDVSTLMKILSLPAWKERNEVYAVWIATLLVDALPEAEIQHEKGTIPFRFRSTLLASIPGRHPVELYSERKETLENPVGKGRTGGVQPDFSIWDGPGQTNQCALVIEVKHYKRPNSRSFADVLVDYARAHPKAEVVLVNHGRLVDLKDRIAAIDPSIVARCHWIEHLVPDASDARGRLAAFVRQARERICPSHLMIDVSLSMRPELTSQSFELWLAAAKANGTRTATLVHTTRVWDGPAENVIARLQTLSWGTWQTLGPRVRELLEEHEEIRLVTDKDGWSDVLEVAPGIAPPRQVSGFLVGRVRKSDLI